LSHSLTIQQSPPDYFEKLGQSCSLHCLNPDSTYARMLWYQQKGRRGALKLIGLLYRESLTTGEEQFTDRFRISGDATNNVTLEISSLIFADSAVYFCAVSQHSATDSLFPIQKPFPNHNFNSVYSTHHHPT
ncbi:KV06 protein, partial [Amia calva]|nr:KV06 protein [Amia calva]MBN3300334.1 KV06 protein [Amia calva]